MVSLRAQQHIAGPSLDSGALLAEEALTCLLEIACANFVCKYQGMGKSMGLFKKLICTYKRTS